MQLSIGISLHVLRCHFKGFEFSVEGMCLGVRVSAKTCSLCEASREGAAPQPPLVNCLLPQVHGAPGPLSAFGHQVLGRRAHFPFKQHFLSLPEQLLYPLCAGFVKLLKEKCTFSTRRCRNTGFIINDAYLSEHPLYGTSVSVTIK